MANLKIANSMKRRASKKTEIKSLQTQIPKKWKEQTCPVNGVCFLPRFKMIF